MRSLFLKFNRVSLIILLVAAVQAYAEDAQNGKINIAVTLSPVGSFVAKSSNLEVKGSTKRTSDRVSADNLELKLDTLQTGISLRDTHMRTKYFETDKHPKAVLKKASGQDGKFSGELVIRGVPKEISGTYQIVGQEFTAKFKTHLSDFDIAKANYMGVGVADEVEVEAILPVPPETKETGKKAPAKGKKKKKRK